MSETIYSFTENPSYHEEIRKIQNTDPVNAETIVNPVIEKVLENTQFVKNQQETHSSKKDNPHSVTKEQIGLGNVDNTADADKPISTATQAALNQKANTSHAHAATDITLDSAHRFVTDSEKSTWNGKANSSHGTHVEYDEGIPCVNGVGSAGTRTMVSRSDHIHPTDTSRAPIVNPVLEGNLFINSSNTSTGINSAIFGERNKLVNSSDCLAAGIENEINNVWAATALGHANYVSGATSAALGFHSRAVGWSGQLVCGEWNVEKASGEDKFIVGRGSGDARANIFRVNAAGAYASGSYNSSGADYAELFEWQDGNPENEDRVGLFVTLDGEKIRLANADDTFILGVISGNPSVIGDVYDDQWQGIYLRDIYGRALWENVEVPDRYIERETINQDGEKIKEIVLLEPAHTERRQKINPDYNSVQPYRQRTERKEWGCVGMIGKLVVIDDGTGTVNGWVKPGNGGIATKSETQTKYRVMSRIDENHIRILIL